MVTLISALASRRGPRWGPRWGRRAAPRPGRTPRPSRRGRATGREGTAPKNATNITSISPHSWAPPCPPPCRTAPGRGRRGERHTHLVVVGWGGPRGPWTGGRQPNKATSRSAERQGSARLRQAPRQATASVWSWNGRRRAPAVLPTDAATGRDGPRPGPGRVQHGRIYTGPAPTTTYLLSF